MEIPQFTRDEDKDEINPIEWLRMINKTDFKSCLVRTYFFGEGWNWWMSMDMDTRWNYTWEE
jgi:hypothetical protein